MAIDDPIQAASVAESRMDLDRIEYRLKDGPDRLDIYYAMIPVTSAGVPCGDSSRRHCPLFIDADIKAEIIDGIKVADALTVIRKIARRTIKAKEQ